jgi:hypothetical protein
MPPVFDVYDMEGEQRFMKNFVREGCETKYPYEVYYGTYSQAEGGSIFRGVDRIRIVQTVIEKTFDLTEMTNLGMMVDRYTVHSTVRQNDLQNVWASFTNIFSPAVPLRRIASYCGEKVGIRMAFVRFLTWSVVPLAVIAVVTYFHPILAVAKLAGFSGQTSSYREASRWLMSSCIMLWAGLFTAFWNHSEQWWIMTWGMDHFELKESVRTEYDGPWVASPVDKLSIVKVYPRHKGLPEDLLQL